METKNFNNKIKPYFSYVGTIGAIISAIAYITIVLIMVFGVAVKHSFSQTIIFAVINAIIGFIIVQFLKIQGIDFAKRENCETLKKHNLLKAKEKKAHSMVYFWVTTTIKDILIKGITLSLTTIGIVYIVISGSQDYTLILLAIVNLFMFACFGLLSLVSAYDYYNDTYIPFLEEKIKNKMEGESCSQLMEKNLEV